MVANANAKAKRTQAQGQGQGKAGRVCGRGVVAKFRLGLREPFCRHGRNQAIDHQWMPRFNGIQIQITNMKGGLVVMVQVEPLMPALTENDRRTDGLTVKPERPKREDESPRTRAHEGGHWSVVTGHWWEKAWNIISMAGWPVGWHCGLSVWPMGSCGCGCWCGYGAMKSERLAKDTPRSGTRERRWSWTCLVCGNNKSAG